MSSPRLQSKSVWGPVVPKHCRVLQTDKHINTTQITDKSIHDHPPLSPLFYNALRHGVCFCMAGNSKISHVPLIRWLLGILILAYTYLYLLAAENTKYPTFPLLVGLDWNYCCKMLTSLFLQFLFLYLRPYVRVVGYLFVTKVLLKSLREWLRNSLIVSA